MNEVEPIEGDLGASILGPTNPARQDQNPDMLRPPTTDVGLLPNLRYSFADTHLKLTDGGWAREVTARELPIATTIAGVNMRLTAGAVRELHWHMQAELGYVLAGSCRISAVDQKGRNFVDDVGPGGLWNFPKGVPHSIQGLGDGVEFLLMFDDGTFSEYETGLLSDVVRMIPKHVIETSLGVPYHDLDRLPKEELYLFASQVPGLLENDRVAAAAGPVPHWFSHSLDRAPVIDCEAGQIREVSSAEFPAMDTMSIEEVTIDPAAMRTLHWHNADEWQYFLQGQARMTVFLAKEGSSRTFNLRAGDVGYVPAHAAHYVENIGSEPVRFLGTFKAQSVDSVDFAQWLALTPPELVQAHLGLSDSAVQMLPKDKRRIVPVRNMAN